MSVSTFVDSLVDKYIVKSKNGTLAGIAGFVFDVRLDESVTLSADVTDHYVESGYAIHDNIITHPVRVTLSGYVGELVATTSTGTINGVLSGAAALATNVGISTTFATQSAQVYSKIEQTVSKVNNILESAKSLASFFTGKNAAKTKQEKAYQFFKKLMGDNADANTPPTLVSVVTPFETFENMAVVNVTPHQGTKTTMMSDFTVELKQFREASTNTVPQVKSGRADSLSSSLVNSGSQTGATKDFATTMNSTTLAVTK